MIKYNGKIIYNKPFAKASFSRYWNNSMYQYEWSIHITSIEHSKLDYTIIGLADEHIGWFSDYKPDGYEFIADNKQLFDYEYHMKLQGIKSDNEAKEKERLTVRLHKDVIVRRGRKVPIGTRGDVFWLGDSGYGMSVGIRCLNGTKVFTALKNVEVYDKETQFKEEMNQLANGDEK